MSTLINPQIQGPHVRSATKPCLQSSEVTSSSSKTYGYIKKFCGPNIAIDDSGCTNVVDQPQVAARGAPLIKDLLSEESIAACKEDHEDNSFELIEDSEFFSADIVESPTLREHYFSSPEITNPPETNQVVSQERSVNTSVSTNLDPSKTKFTWNRGDSICIGGILISAASVAACLVSFSCFDCGNYSSIWVAGLIPGYYCIRRGETWRPEPKVDPLADLLAGPFSLKPENVEKRYGKGIEFTKDLCQRGLDLLFAKCDQLAKPKKISLSDETIEALFGSSQNTAFWHKADRKDQSAIVDHIIHHLEKMGISSSELYPRIRKNYETLDRNFAPIAVHFGNMRMRNLVETQFENFANAEECREALFGKEGFWDIVPEPIKLQIDNMINQHFVQLAYEKLEQARDHVQQHEKAYAKKAKIDPLWALERRLYGMYNFKNPKLRNFDEGFDLLSKESMSVLAKACEIGKSAIAKAQVEAGDKITEAYGHLQNEQAKIRQELKNLVQDNNPSYISQKLRLNKKLIQLDQSFQKFRKDQMIKVKQEHDKMEAMLSIEKERMRDAVTLRQKSDVDPSWIGTMMSQAYEQDANKRIQVAERAFTSEMAQLIVHQIENGNDLEGIINNVFGSEFDGFLAGKAPEDQRKIISLALKYAMNYIVDGVNMREALVDAVSELNHPKLLMILDEDSNLPSLLDRNPYGTWPSIRMIRSSDLLVANFQEHLIGDRQFLIHKNEKSQFQLVIADHNKFKPGFILATAPNEKACFEAAEMMRKSGFKDVTQIASQNHNASIANPEENIIVS